MNGEKPLTAYGFPKSEQVKWRPKSIWNKLEISRKTRRSSAERRTQVVAVTKFLEYLSTESDGAMTHADGFIFYDFQLDRCNRVTAIAGGQ